MSQLKQFLSDRYQALMSMDKDKILAFALKYDLHHIPSSDETFWIAVHKARTGANDLPKEERLKSHQWLIERNFESWYEDEIPTNNASQANS